MRKSKGGDKIKDKLWRLEYLLSQQLCFAKGSILDEVTKVYKLRFRLNRVIQLSGTRAITRQVITEINERNEKH
jgi:hypothetical protein